MNITRWLAVILIVTLLAVFVQPARAEAMEPSTILLIAGVALAIVIVIVVVVIANVHESRHANNPDPAVMLAQVAQPQTPVMLTQVEQPQASMIFVQVAQPQTP